MFRAFRKTRIRGFVIGLTATLAALLMHLGGLLRGPEHLAYDARMRYFNDIAETDRIVHIDLTDQTFDLVAPWPWPRRLTADLIRTLHELGAEYIVLDLEFTRPKDPRLTKLGTIDDDAELAAALADAGNVFVPVSFKMLPPGESLAALRSRARRILRDRPDITQAEFSRLLGEQDFFGPAGLLRFKMAELLRREFALSADELAERLGAQRQAVTAVWAGVKRAVARELVEAFLGDHPDADLSAAQQAILGARQDQESPPDPNDIKDLADAYRWCRSWQAVLELAGEQLEVPPGRIPEIVSPRPPLEPLGHAAAGSGFVSFAGRGNVVRTTPLLARYGNRVVKHLGFAVACQVAGIADSDIRVTPEGLLEFPHPQKPDLRLRVPLDADGGALINWSPGRAERPNNQAPWLTSFRHIPAARIMEIPLYRRQLESHRRAWLLAKAAAVELTTASSAAEAYWESLLELEQLRKSPPTARDQARLAELQASTEATEAQALQALTLAFKEMQQLEPQDPDEAAEFDQVRRLHSDLVQGRLRPQLDRLDGLARQKADAAVADLKPGIQGKIALVGYTASAIADMKPTPVYDIAPGVMVYSNLINQLLAGRMPRLAPQGANLLAIAAGGLLVTGAAVAAPAVSSAVIWLSAGLIYTVANLLIYRQSDIFLALVAPLAAMAAAWGAVTAYRQLTEQRERRRFSKALAQYVSPAVAKRISLQADRLDLSPVARRVTCFFSDLRGFTALSERLGPERTRAVLNPYLETMSGVLHRHQAMINKFMGDGIFAFFNAPIFACHRHAERACQSALAAFEALERLQADPPPGAPADELKSLSMRVGLATGTVFVGDYGSEAKLDYTAIGDPVNLAARLEPANKVLGTKIALPESTRESAGNRFAFRRLGLIQVAGKTEGVPVYELLGPVDQVDAERLRYLELFEGALQALQDRDFQQARVGFEQCLCLRPDDLCARRYLEMIRALQTHPPDAGWQPVLELTSK